MKLTNQTKFKETELGLIPEDWEVSSVEKYCDLISSGGTPARDENAFWQDGTIDWLKTKELKDGNIYTTEEKITDTGLKKSAAKVFPADSVVMAMYGATVGKLGIIKSPMTTNQACCVMVPSKNCDYRYLYYQLLINRDEIISRANGAAQQNLNVGKIAAFLLPFPPIDAQQKIAEVLGALDEKIELNRRMNKTLDSLAQAVFKKWFIDDADPNWKTGKIGDISEEVLRGFTTSYVEKSNLINLNQKVNRGEYLDESNFKYYADDTIVPKNKFAKRGDILINSLGQGTLGRVHFYLEDTDNVVVDQHITIIRTGAAKLKPEYLYYYLTNCCDLESLITGSTGMLMLNISHIRNFEIQIPNIKIQNKFSTFVQSLNDKKSFNNKEIKSLSQIRDSLLPRLMSGKLRVK